MRSDLLTRPRKNFRDKPRKEDSSCDKISVLQQRDLKRDCQKKVYSIGFQAPSTNTSNFVTGWTSQGVRRPTSSIWSSSYINQPVTRTRLPRHCLNASTGQ